MSLSSLKKESSSALKQFNLYLGRDKEGRDNLKKVERYVGELRRAVAAKNSELEVQQKTISALSEERALREAKLISVRDERNTERESHQHTRTKLKTALLALAQLQEHVAREEEDHDELRLQCEDGFPLFQTLVKNMKKPPSPIGKMPATVFDLSDVIKDLKGEQFMLLGRFVALCCICGLSPVGFTLDEEEVKQGKFRIYVPETHLRKVAQWFKRYFPPSNLQEKILDKSIGP
jgi:hypothetical protein